MIYYIIFIAYPKIIKLKMAYLVGIHILILYFTKNSVFNFLPWLSSAIVVRVTSWQELFFCRINTAMLLILRSACKQWQFIKNSLKTQLINLI